jgi:hypothetical protein
MKKSTHAMCTLVILSGLAMAQPNPNSGQTPEGAWSFALTANGVPSCSSAPTVFTREGTVIGSTCFLLASPGYGSWARTGNGEFAFTMIGNSYALPDTLAGSYKIRGQGNLTSDRAMLLGRYRVAVFDLAGNIVLEVTGTFTAKRVQVEPLN